jgi:diaminopimelate epimerase
VRIEKWQALGNDYLIAEATALPFELTPARITRICDHHLGAGADGLLVLGEADEPGFVARLRIFNPDGSEAELSGNGAREAVMYLRHRGWTDSDQFSIQTVAGEIRPTITGPTTCRVDMGRAKLRSKDFPTGGEDGRGELTVHGRTWRFQHVSVGNPQCAIRVDDADQFPNRTNVSFYREVEPGVIRTRIFERGVGETMSSGTGASGAAIAYVLAGGDSPVTVRLDGGELEVDVGEDLHLDLTGWAVPVWTGELTPEFIEELTRIP